MRASLLGLALMLFGCAADESRDTGAQLGVYSEFMDDETVRTHLRELGAAGVDLNLALPNERIGDAGLAALLRDAQSDGVSVRLWLVLSREEGYWPNEDNVERFGTEVDRLLDWLDVENLAAEAIVFDIEPSFAYSEQLRGLWSGGLGEVTAVLSEHIDPQAHDVARAQMTDIVRRVQARGLLAVAVTYPQILDDAVDGDDDLADALDIPIRDVPFDEIAFMVYQTAFAEAVDRWIGPGLVRSFAADARERYGDRGGIALGTVGTAGIFEPTGPVYEDPDTLAEDIAAARAEGIERIEVYSLDGMVGLGGSEAWMDAMRAAPRKATSSSQATLVRSLATGLDAELDRR